MMSEPRRDLTLSEMLDTLRWILDNDGDLPQKGSKREQRFIRLWSRRLNLAPDQPPSESTQVDESGSSEPSGLDGAVLELCPVCGGSRRVTLRDDWQRGVEMGQAVPIVGCGNPWHYTNAEAASLNTSASRSPDVVEALRRLLDECYTTYHTPSSESGPEEWDEETSAPSAETCRRAAIALAALPAQREPTPELDVERLTKVLWNSVDEARAWLDGEATSHNFASHLAAAYAEAVERTHS